MIVHPSKKFTRNTVMVFPLPCHMAIAVGIKYPPVRTAINIAIILFVLMYIVYTTYEIIQNKKSLTTILFYMHTELLTRFLQGLHQARLFSSSCVVFDNSSFCCFIDSFIKRCYLLFCRFQITFRDCRFEIFHFFSHGPGPTQVEYAFGLVGFDTLLR